LLGAFQVWGVSVAEGWCRRVRGRRRPDGRWKPEQAYTWCGSVLGRRPHTGIRPTRL